MKRNPAQRPAIPQRVQNKDINWENRLALSPPAASLQSTACTTSYPTGLVSPVLFHSKEHISPASPIATGKTRLNDGLRSTFHGCLCVPCPLILRARWKDRRARAPLCADLLCKDRSCSKPRCWSTTRCGFSQGLAQRSPLGEANIQGGEMTT